MSYSDFRKTILKTDGNHHFKVTNSNGTKEVWRWIKKNKWLDIGQSITERELGLIIKAINLSLQDQLLQGKEVILPCRMGKLEIRKFEAKVEIKDNKVVTTLPINWKKTLQLWYNDEESRESKRLVRWESRERFAIYYNKTKANYNNKSFYQFIPSRVFKINLKQRILDGEIDALLLGKKYELR